MEDIGNYTEQLSKTIDRFITFLKDGKEFRHVSIVNTIQCSIDMLLNSINNSGIKLIHNLK